MKNYGLSTVGAWVFMTAVWRCAVQSVTKNSLLVILIALKIYLRGIERLLMENLSELKKELKDNEV